MNPYETDKLLGEYLLFHYGSMAEVLPHAGGPAGALNYPARCVSEGVDTGWLRAQSRALDIGCAVGRSSFELARHCGEVVGIDFSHRFIDAARTLQETGWLDYRRTEEGVLTTLSRADVPADLDRTRVHFEVGDAMSLRADLGVFDVVLLANLIDRLVHPRHCLAQLARLVKPNGQLVITSPYTWLEEFTPRENWLGGFMRGGKRVSTREGLISALEERFDLVAVKDLPFLIREHARKFQWSVAEATLWRRKVE